MRKLPLSLAAALLASPAAAQVVGPLGPVTGQVKLVQSGLGDDGRNQIPGVATQGNWTADGFLHVFMYSGDRPYGSGWVRVLLPTTFYPPDSTPNHQMRKRPGCVAFPWWTDDTYADGYSNPHPWGLQLSGGAYDNSDATGPTVNINWMGQFPPRSTFSFWMMCTAKP